MGHKTTRVIWGTYGGAKGHSGSMGRGIGPHGEHREKARATRGIWL